MFSHQKTEQTEITVKELLDTMYENIATGKSYFLSKKISYIDDKQDNKCLIVCMDDHIRYFSPGYDHYSTVSEKSSRDDLYHTLERNLKIESENDKVKYQLLNLTLNQIEKWHSDKKNYLIQDWPRYLLDLSNNKGYKSPLELLPLDIIKTILGHLQYKPDHTHLLQVNTNFHHIIQQVPEEVLAWAVDWLFDQAVMILPDEEEMKISNRIQRYPKSLKAQLISLFKEQVDLNWPHIYKTYKGLFDDHRYGYKEMWFLVAEGMLYSQKNIMLSRKLFLSEEENKARTERIQQRIKKFKAKLISQLRIHNAKMNWKGFEVSGYRIYHYHPDILKISVKTHIHFSTSATFGLRITPNPNSHVEVRRDYCYPYEILQPTDIVNNTWQQVFVTIGKQNVNIIDQLKASNFFIIDPTMVATKEDDEIDVLAKELEAKFIKNKALDSQDYLKRKLDGLKIAIDSAARIITPDVKAALIKALDAQTVLISTLQNNVHFKRPLAVLDDTFKEQAEAEADAALTALRSASSAAHLRAILYISYLDVKFRTQAVEAEQCATKPDITPMVNVISIFPHTLFGRMKIADNVTAQLPTDEVSLLRKRAGNYIFN